MAHSYLSWYMHCVFSTKGHKRIMTPDLQERLWPYVGGIARENKMTALTVGGTDDHIHILLSLPATLSVAKGL